MNLVLVGFMASGKTSVGRRVARRLGYRFMDTDQYIESEQGTNIAEIFDRGGESYFRELETQLVKRLQRFKNYVFSTGGGILTTEGNLELLKALGPVIFLKADPNDILARLENDTRRPKVQGGALRERVLSLLAERMPRYMESDIVIETVGKTPNQVAGEVIRRIGEYRRGTAAQSPPPGEAPAEAPPKGDRGLS